MSAEANEVFSAALASCNKLQEQFPADQRLRSIIDELEHWVQAQEGTLKPSSRRAYRRHIEPRDLRPLSEEVAGLVYKAAARAEQLKLS